MLKLGILIFYLNYHVLSKIFFFKIPLKEDLRSLWDKLFPVVPLDIRDTLYVSKNTPLYKNGKRPIKKLGDTHFYLIFQILILSFSSFLFSLISLETLEPVFVLEQKTWSWNEHPKITNLLRLFSFIFIDTSLYIYIYQSYFFLVHNTAKFKIFINLV